MNRTEFAANSCSHGADGHDETAVPMRSQTLLVMVSLSGCAAKIQGTVHLVDAGPGSRLANEECAGHSGQHDEHDGGTVEQASHAVTVDRPRASSSRPRIGCVPGTYKVGSEPDRVRDGDADGFRIGKYTSKKIEFKLKKIQGGPGAKTIQGSRPSDEDKIINPGEVNIQPPTM